MEWVKRTDIFSISYNLQTKYYIYCDICKEKIDINAEYSYTMRTFDDIKREIKNHEQIFTILMSFSVLFLLLIGISLGIIISCEETFWLGLLVIGVIGLIVCGQCGIFKYGLVRSMKIGSLQEKPWISLEFSTVSLSTTV